MTDGLSLALLATRSAAATLIENRDELCDLDSVAGDGDHGFAMAAAATGVLARLDAAPPPSGEVLLVVVGEEFAKVGGSMGALLSVAAEAAAASAAEGAGTTCAESVGAMLGAAQAAIEDLGGARPGDKTLLDAMVAARVAASACDTADSPAQVLRSAADGARAGAESTADMAARVGRASRLGDRALGSPDAGATSFALILDAVASAYARGV